MMVLNSTLPEWRLDDMCMRMITPFFKVGRDEDRNPPNFSSWTYQPYAPVPLLGGRTPQLVNERVSVRGDHKNLNREITAAGIVLLKNTGSCH
jgi:beta-glucosidase